MRFSDHVDPEGAIPLGAAEIWVESASGRRYAAPDLILHYVDVHDYLPPVQFVEAVLHGRPISPQ